jgi:stage V sporulation protein SpoVS
LSGLTEGYSIEGLLESLTIVIAWTGHSLLHAPQSIPSFFEMMIDNQIKTAIKLVVKCI